MKKQRNGLISKFHIIAEFESLPNAPSPSYFKSDRFEYFRRTSFDLEQLGTLKNLLKNLNEFVSPFSEEALDILKLNVKFYKIASGEVTNHRLLEKLNKTKKKIFMSLVGEFMERN